MYYWGTLTLVAVTILILFFLKRYGIIDTPIFEYKRLPAQNFLYVENVGPYMKVGDIFHNFSRVLAPLFKDTSKTAGIFYDNPNLIADPKQCRSCLGVIINDDEIERAEEFTRENKVYKLVRLPEVDVISTSYPVHGFLSYWFLPLRVYPAMHKFVEDNGIDGSFHGGIELYNCNNESQTIEFIYPYGERKQEYRLSTMRTPEYKVHRKSD